MFVCVPDGFLDPFLCRNIRWIIAVARMAIGRIKCSEKNRFSVGCEMDGPPHSQVVNSLPTTGMADSTPVITVAPQNDIWPHGSTYPRNAVAIVIKIIAIPLDQTFIFLYGEEKYTPRAVCAYRRIKNKDAPFMCVIRMIHPILVSCIIITILVKAILVSAT